MRTMGKTKISDLEVKAYYITDDVSIEDRGYDRWAIVHTNGNNYNKDGTWDYEPLPSSRTDKWLEEHRWKTAQEALDCYAKWEYG